MSETSTISAFAEAQHSKIREMEIRHRDELEHQMGSAVQMDSIKTELTNTRASLEMAGKNLKTRQDEISRLETLVESNAKHHAECMHERIFC